MNAYFKSPVLEIFLGQIILYLTIWFWNDYLALYLTLVFFGIFSAIMVIAKIAEFLSETKPVPRLFFLILTISIIAPAISAIVAVFVIGIQPSL